MSSTHPLCIRMRLRQVGTRSLLAVATMGLTACGQGTTSPSATFKLTSITPTIGSTVGGDRLTLVGTALPATAQVLFGGVAGTNVTAIDANTLSVVTPAHEAGTVDVQIVAGQERATLKSAFTFERGAVTNGPPMLTSVTAQGSRVGEPARYAAVGERIVLVATVTDDVTPVSSLTFEWTTSAGTIEGSGDRVTLVAGPIAAIVNVGLTVTERYRNSDARGLPVDAEHRVTGSVVVNVHDEVREIGDMAIDFLRLFSISSVAPQDVVHNFRDSCGANGTGKQDELAQTTANRANFTILTDWFVGPARTTVSFNGVSPFRARRGDGWSAVDVRWRSQCKVRDTSIGCSAVGQTGSTSGVDWVTAIYDTTDRRWWLCDSDYQGTGTLTAGFDGLPE